MEINFHKLYRKVRKRFLNTIRFIIVHIKVAFEFFDSDKYKREDVFIGSGVYLYYWKIHNIDSSYECSTENIGDFLSYIVVKHFLPVNTKCEKNGSKKISLYAVGSLIGLRRQDAVVWGSGILYPSYDRILRMKKSKYDIRAVRGPETRKVLMDIGKKCPEIYGDPAILMPFVYEPPDKTKKYKTTIIFNHGDNNTVVPSDQTENVLSILTTDYKRFIDRIVRSEMVISSSLHGIILAESYNVPAVLLRQENQELFKFKDWYYSTGRESFIFADSVSQALAMDPMPIPDLSEMRKKLIESFPKDLW